MSQTIYGVPNSFCWAEVFTHDEKQSKDFYRKLFSWTYSSESPAEISGTEHMHYTHAMIKEGAVAGMMQIDEEMKKHGMVPYWGSYIAVNDVEKTVALAKKFGAKVMMEPTLVPNAGRMAMLQDPTGAYINLWQASDKSKSVPARNLHGMVGWNELITSDNAKARQFYESVFGWKTKEEAVNDIPYISCTLGDKYVAGIMQMKDSPSHWGLYFTTANINESRRIAKTEGAKEVTSLIALPQIGSMILIQDPQGAMFWLFEWA